MCRNNSVTFDKTSLFLDFGIERFYHKQAFAGRNSEELPFFSWVWVRVIDCA